MSVRCLGSVLVVECLRFETDLRHHGSYEDGVSGGGKAFKKDSFAQNRKELNLSFMTQRMYTL